MIAAMWTLLLAAALQSAPPAEEPPVPREAHVFADWVIACDNGRRCQAIGLRAEGAENDAGFLMVERDAGPDAALTFTLAQAEGAPARLVMYNQPLPVRLVAANGDFSLEIPDRAAFLEQILYADAIEVQNASGAAIGQLSLNGLRHALLYMDEAQGRLHTPSALIRTGRRAAADAPPPVPTVRVAPATREAPLVIPPARITRARRDNRCAIADVGGPDEAETAALGGGRTLILLGCGAGAYNFSSVPLIATRDGRDIRIEPAPFDIPLDPFEEEEGHRMLVNASWDPASMTISEYSKARGLGDCGSRSTYGWDGARFRLLAREEMPECRSSLLYLTTWRTERN